MCSAGRIAIGAAVVFAATLAFAASPPDSVHYQGVLRDSEDRPIDGVRDMVFRFFNTETVGDEILVDAHDAAHGNPVTVSGGLFGVALGGGAVSDGTGPGTYASLSEVFGDYGSVWLQLTIAGETLAPRVRMHSAAYALNATQLEGLDSSQMLRSDASDTFSSGTLTIGAAATLDNAGSLLAPRLSDRDDTSYWLDPSGDTSGRLFGDLFIGHGSAADDDYLYFDTGAEYLRWDNASTRFALSDTLAISGALQTGSIAGTAYGYNRLGTGTPASADMGTTGDLFTTGDVEVAEALYLSGTMYMEGDAAGPEVDQYIYFSDFASRSGAWIKYDPLYSRFDLSGSLKIASSVGGVEAVGSNQGGRFEDSNGSGFAVLGINDDGIQASGNRSGGYFRDYNDDGYAYVGYGDRGIWAKGTFAGGTFSHLNDVTFWADVATPTHKIVGTGAVSFAQNHPYDPNRVVVYTAPEGDEVAVYTRGTARLEAGEARVRLGETFAWVTNPDIGLTAQVTPLGDCLGLYVESVTPSELVVRELGGGTSGIAFDYLVHGLRIGFEELSPVQPKTREAPLPAVGGAASAAAQPAELQAFSALARFKAMTGAGDVDLRGARALREAIDASGAQRIGWVDPQAEDPDRAGREPLVQTAEVSTGYSSPAAAETGREERREPLAAVELSEVSESPRADPLRVFPVSAPAAAGDVLVLDLERPGYLRPASVAADSNVVGIAAADPTVVDGRLEIELVDSRFAWVKVDASYGAVLAGDLLTSSPTPGHAMAMAAPVPGTIVGKALEPLDSGTGVIRVLVISR